MRDTERIRKDCSFPHYVTWTKERPMLLAAFEYIQAAYGQKFGKYKALLDNVDYFNDVDCLDPKKVLKQLKKEMRDDQRQKVKDSKRSRILTR
jgi:hypothetical protein